MQENCIKPKKILIQGPSGKADGFPHRSQCELHTIKINTVYKRQIQDEQLCGLRFCDFCFDILRNRKYFRKILNFFQNADQFLKF
jgi:hypothetical protein